MSKIYGLPYQGSKSRIAEKIIDLLPAGGTFYELFAGGCAVTHCAILSKKWDRFVINDIRSGQTKFFTDAIEGNLNEGYDGWVSREEFFKKKDTDPFIRSVWSFCNNQKDYIYGPEKEKIKSIVHRMLTAQTVEERMQFFSQFITALYSYLLASNTSSLLTDIKRIQHLEAIKRIKKIENIKQSTSEGLIERCEYDYQEVPLDSKGIIYCDIPYANTKGYGKQNFDYKRFYEWCEKQTMPVFISELNMPEDKFVSIAEMKLNHNGSSTKVKPVTEKIFIPKHQAVT